MSTPLNLCLKKLKSLEKSRERDPEDDSSSIGRLPDELILQILNKLIDLKTLLFCYLVSRRFSSIVLEVDAISFRVPHLNPPINPEAGDVAPTKPLISYFSSESLISGGKFLLKRKRLKSLCFEFPSLFCDNAELFNYKVKFGSRVELFTCVFPKSICDNDGSTIKRNDVEEEDDDMFDRNRVIFFGILKVVMAWHRMLLVFIGLLPVLEKVSLTDSGRGGRLSLSGEKLREVKQCVNISALEAMFSSAVDPDIVKAPAPYIVSNCYIPVLSLPVSGYVMKGVDVYVMEMKDLLGEYDSLMNSYDGFEDKEEVAYTEAVMEIFKKHKGLMHTLDIPGDPPV